MNLHTLSDLDTFLVNYSEFAVVEFCAGPNSNAKPSLEDLKTQFKQVYFTRLSADSVKNLGYIDRYNVGSTPTFVLFKEQEVIERINGNDWDAIATAISKHVSTIEDKSEDLPSVLSAHALGSMWNSPAMSNADSSALPPPHHFEDTLFEFRITLLEKTQHKAVHVVDGSRLVEPTLALYCPIEGGEYAIDATVKELAKKTDSEVQVIDMAQVAASEWGIFGKAAAGFCLTNNPLGAEHLIGQDDHAQNLQALESFWRTLINSNPTTLMTSASEPSVDCENTSAPPPDVFRTRPRIIYIRDFGLLSSSSSIWFPPLYSAVRARRTNGLGPEFLISNPTTIIFGFCPPLSLTFLTPPAGRGQPPPDPFYSYDPYQQLPQYHPLPEHWDECATKERAERLKFSKEKWDQGTLLEDLPPFRSRIRITKEELEEEKERERGMHEVEELKEKEKEVEKPDEASKVNIQDEIKAGQVEMIIEPRNKSDLEAKDQDKKEDDDVAGLEVVKTSEHSGGKPDSESSCSLAEEMERITEVAEAQMTGERQGVNQETMAEPKDEEKNGLDSKTQDERDLQDKGKDTFEPEADGIIQLPHSSSQRSRSPSPLPQWYPQSPPPSLPQHLGYPPFPPPDLGYVPRSPSVLSFNNLDWGYAQHLDGFFYSCIIAPAKRNTELERTSRENRRRELNELMLRMTVGAKGGQMESGAAPVLIKEESKEEKSEDMDKIRDDGLLNGWGERILVSDTLKCAVDRALRIRRLSDADEKEQGPVLITWAQLQDAWRANKRRDEEREAWTMGDDSSDVGEEKALVDEPEVPVDEEKASVDEVIKKVKASNLDQYEQRLMGCIVDIANLSTTFENVHLPKHVVDSIRSVVSLPLIFPDAFKSGILKQQAISGALLFGPPGTGKTLVVRALAKESGSRMLAIKPSDIAEMKTVRSVFKLARRLEPCVVFIDEIDSLLGSRKGCGSSERHTSMLTEFMQEMDGLVTSSVTVIGATNRPFDIDDAVLRRLPCRLLVDLPEEKAREEILKIMLQDDELGSDVSVSNLAKKTDRFSGSDLKHLCVAAAMDALKESIKPPWLSEKADSKDVAGTNSMDSSRSEPGEGVLDSNPLDDNSSFSPSNPNSEAPSSISTGLTTPDERFNPESLKPRTLYARHFIRAFMDVAPSSADSQGSLRELRKWNSRFGTGTRKQITGLGPVNLDSTGEGNEEEPPVDEVIEKVRAADLDEHEERLLGCIVDVVKLSTTFENVHLPSQVIDNIRSIVSLPLLFPDAFKSGILKQQAISGALLFGPPGTGKTLVARALAKESGSRMLIVKPSDIVDKWIGETEKFVRSLFKLARRLKPCVVFIDEIDSLLGSRASNMGNNSSQWHTSMLTEFMQEMDGLMASSVIVIGATNRPFDIDDAVLRRLPCRLLIDLPGVEAREEILKIMLRDDELAPDVSINGLAKKTDRFSGSDLKNLCVAAAMDALKEGVKLPWLTKKVESNNTAATASEGSFGSTSTIKDSTKPEPLKPRVLAARHFGRALMDVAPSSSESQSSLSELRQWNTHFGTGERDQPRATRSSPYNYEGSVTSSSRAPKQSLHYAPIYIYVFLASLLLIFQSV